jgi:hypothetical protein
MSAIKLGPNHPVARLWSQIQVMGVQQVRQAASSIITACFEACSSDNKAGEVFRRVSCLHAIRHMSKRGALSYTSARSLSQGYLKQFALHMDSEDNIQWYHWAVMYQSSFMHESGKFVDAYANLEPVRSFFFGHHQELDFEKVKKSAQVGVLEYYSLKGRILEALERVDEATPYYVCCYDNSIKIANDHLWRVARAAAGLESHYRRKNDIEAAVSFHAEFTASWDRLVATGMYEK